MRCPDCNKFTPVDNEDPEIDSLDVSLTDDTVVEVTAQVIIRRNCAECGTQLKEGNFEICDSFEIPAGHDGEGHDLEVTEDTSCIVEKTEGKGRGMRTFIGAEISFKIACSCEKLEFQDTFSDYLQASAFEEVV